MSDMGKYEKDVARVREALTDRRLDIVARGTGLHYNTIRNVFHGRFKPRPETLENLINYLFG